MNDAVRPPPDSETERLKSALESRERAVRLYSVLSRVNEAIVRCREEQDLHQQVCRILVEDGGYALAWIGQPQADRVVPTVASGSSAEYVREITVAIDGEFGRGPTGTSIREGRAVVNQDFLANAAMGPWRDRAMQHGFRSSAAFPLRRNGAVIASLTLYAREASAFDDEHIRLLEALAMGFTISSPGGYALVGMAAATAAAIHAPLLASVMIFELSGDYVIVLPLVLATALATLLSRRIQRDSVYTAELARKGVGWEVTLDGRRVVGGRQGQSAAGSQPGD